ncbi:MAG: hypothetical protein JW764_09380 [Chlorobiaceae bacterium]|nr:hypothetical protein [Chlorobiaceae bacterium]
MDALPMKGTARRVSAVETIGLTSRKRPHQNPLDHNKCSLYSMNILSGAKNPVFNLLQ